MLELKLRFESSWTNSFANSTGREPRFTSGSELSDSVKGLTRPTPETIIEEGATREENSGPLPYLRQLQAANAKMQYRVPDNYDNTVRGVLARLVGEVRRLDMLEADHLALRAFAHGHALVSLDSIYSQTVSITSAVDNLVKAGGAGLIEHSELYQHGEIAKHLFGFLGMSMAQLELHADQLLEPSATPLGSQWTPASPSVLIHRLTTLKDEQSAQVKAANERVKAGEAYSTPYPNLVAALTRHLPKQAVAALTKTKDRDEASNAETPTKDPIAQMWWLAAALVVARIHALSEEQRQAYIKAQVLTALGNFSGLAMSGMVGSVTPKDMFKFASGRSQVSSRVPYSVTLPLATSNRDGSPLMAPAGVIKKDGSLVFTLTGHPQLEAELHAAIKNASVGPLHFGKKGVAWLEKMELTA